MTKIKVKKLTEEAIIPTRSNATDAGWDLYALEDVLIQPGCTEPIPTGIALQPPKGYYGQINDRSGLGRKGLKIHGGVCDQGYTGEYVVCLTNSSHKNNTGFPNDYKVKKGDRVAQVVFLRYLEDELEEVESLESEDRGDSGFGSTGR